jgi:uncharacterized RDD family membrane protein YckC
VSQAAEVISDRPAGFWIRAGAFLIDAIFLVLVATAVEFVVGEIPKIFSGGMLGMIYFSSCHGVWGQTLGKMIFKIRVVTVEGLPISMKTAWFRSVGTLFSQLTLGIGYLMAGLRSDKRGVAPVSWTPHHWGGKERPRCRRAIGRTRRRSGGR